MNSFLLFLSTLFTACVLISCNPSRKILLDAGKLEQGALYADAYSKYDYAYRTYANADARVGMKRVAQRIYDQKIQNARMLCMAENYESALTAYEDAISYRNSLSDLSLTSMTDPNTDYATCRASYIRELYKRAENLVKSEDYDNAQLLIRKIYSLDRNNQEAGYLETMCEILPNYTAGQIAMEKGMWRDAYVYFSEVCMIDAGFRDARALRDEALEKASFTLVYRINDNPTVADMFEEALAAVIKGKLLGKDNPFIEILEREDLDMIYEEQQETLNPQFEEEGGAELGKLKRARYILTGEFVNYRFDKTADKQTRCDCASAYNIYSDKVNCYVTNSSVSLQASFKYKLMNAETGKLYKSDLIQFNQSDIGREYAYEIQKKLSLTSPTGMRDHDVNLSGMRQPANDPLKSQTDLNQQLFEEISVKLAAAMESFRP